MDEGRGLTRITTTTNNDEIYVGSIKIPVSDLKKLNNQLGDDVGKIDIQEEKEKIDMRGGMIELPNMLRIRNETIINLKF